jgi:hypothetical protein
LKPTSRSLDANFIRRHRARLWARWSATAFAAMPLYLH